MEFKRRMQEIADRGKGKDYEVAHINADMLMVEMLRRFGFNEGCDIYETLERYCA